MTKTQLALVLLCVLAGYAVGLLWELLALRPPKYHGDLPRKAPEKPSDDGPENGEDYAGRGLRGPMWATFGASTAALLRSLLKDAEKSKTRGGGKV